MEHDHTNHEHHNHVHHEPKNSLAVPISIVIAGAFIALAIFFTNSNSTPKVQTLEQVLTKIAKASGINTSKFDKCLAAGTYSQKVSDSVAAAQSTGGNGTPWSIIVGPTGKKYPLSGAQPIESVKALIDKALKDTYVAKDANLEKMAPVTAADHIRGDINAPVKVVLYSDLECPFCKRFHGTMQDIMKAYSTDKVAWVFRPFPIAQLHPKAVKEAEAAECAAEIGGNDAFWKFIDKVEEVTPGNNKLDEAKI